MRWYVLAALVAMAVTVEARMYQWVNPQTGTVQFAGDPPPWYRSHEGGARVLVFEKGKIIDDTAIAVPGERGEVLRQEAFEESDERKRLQALKKLEQAARRQAARQAAEEEMVASEAPGEEEAAEPTDRQTIEQLKEIIQQWDRQASGPEKQDESVLDPERLKKLVSEWDRLQQNIRESIGIP